MRIHKTNQKDRGVYNYTTTVRTEKGEYVEKTMTLKPGENGVTELDIKMLHLNYSQVSRHKKVKNIMGTD